MAVLTIHKTLWLGLCQVNHCIKSYVSSSGFCFVSVFVCFVSNFAEVVAKWSKQNLHLLPQRAAFELVQLLPRGRGWAGCALASIV